MSVDNRHTSVEVEVEGHESLREGACRVIAEAGVNHNNSIERAIEMCRRAAAGGSVGDQVPALQGGGDRGSGLPQVLVGRDRHQLPVRGVSALRPSRLRRLRGGRGGLSRARHRLLRHPVRPRRGRGTGEDRRPPLQGRQWRHHRPAAAGRRREDGQAVAALDRCRDARRDPACDRVDRSRPRAAGAAGLHPDLPDPGRGRRLRPDRNVQTRARPLPVRGLRPYPGPGGGLDGRRARRRLHREALHPRQAAGRGPGPCDQRRPGGAGRDGARLRQGIGAARRRAGSGCARASAQRARTRGARS